MPRFEAEYIGPLGGVGQLCPAVVVHGVCFDIISPQENSDNPWMTLSGSVRQRRFTSLVFESALTSGRDRRAVITQTSQLDPKGAATACVKYPRQGQNSAVRHASKIASDPGWRMRLTCENPCPAALLLFRQRGKAAGKPGFAANGIFFRNTTPGTMTKAAPTTHQHVCQKKCKTSEPWFNAQRQRLQSEPGKRRRDSSDDDGRDTPAKWVARKHFEEREATRTTRADEATVLVHGILTSLRQACAVARRRREGGEQQPRQLAQAILRSRFDPFCSSTTRRRDAAGIPGRGVRPEESSEKETRGGSRKLPGAQQWREPTRAEPLAHRLLILLRPRSHCNLGVGTAIMTAWAARHRRRRRTPGAGKCERRTYTGRCVPEVPLCAPSKAVQARILAALPDLHKSLNQHARFTLAQQTSTRTLKRGPQQTLSRRQHGQKQVPAFSGVSYPKKCKAHEAVPALAAARLDAQLRITSRELPRRSPCSLARAFALYLLPGARRDGNESSHCVALANSPAAALGYAPRPSKQKQGLVPRQVRSTSTDSTRDSPARSLFFGATTTVPTERPLRMLLQQPYYVPAWSTRGTKAPHPLLLAPRAQKRTTILAAKTGATDPLYSTIARKSKERLTPSAAARVSVTTNLGVAPRPLRNRQSKTTPDMRMSSFTALNGASPKAADPPTTPSDVADKRSASDERPQSSTTHRSRTSPDVVNQKDGLRDQQRPGYQHSGYAQVEGGHKRKRSDSAKGRREEQVQERTPDTVKAPTTANSRASYRPLKQEYRRHDDDERRDKESSWQGGKGSYERQSNSPTPTQGRTEEQVGEALRKATGRMDHSDYNQTSPDSDDRSMVGYGTLYMGEYKQGSVFQHDPNKRKRNFSKRTKTGM
ncbi:hypothetical protein Purlil1_13661 [Purpureocillium lilacinum]|uniref:Uncharacterized protein n=1 Tax=Purpureocillium lilacinum TaxID=33203 RepID=A0ABR0BDJ8_PURLI|nr:hypothetical protein Purlil1_13661 [Purpureocillium lilacinum]